MNVAAQTRTATVPLVSLRGITKVYGATSANDGIDLDIRLGEVIGLVDGNGVGKSTLMKVLCGGVPASAGQILLDGREAPAGHDAAAAQAHGIRMVHQELSLCTNLTVAENFFVEAPDTPRPGPAGARPTGPGHGGRSMPSFATRQRHLGLATEDLRMRCANPSVNHFLHRLGNPLVSEPSVRQHRPHDTRRWKPWRR